MTCGSSTRCPELAPVAACNTSSVSFQGTDWWPARLQRSDFRTNWFLTVTFAPFENFNTACTIMLHGVGTGTIKAPLQTKKNIYFFLKKTNTPVYCGLLTSRLNHAVLEHQCPCTAPEVACLEPASDIPRAPKCLLKRGHRDLDTCTAPKQFVSPNGLGVFSPSFPE